MWICFNLNIRTMVDTIIINCLRCIRTVKTFEKNPETSTIPSSIVFDTTLDHTSIWGFKRLNIEATVPLSLHAALP